MSSDLSISSFMFDMSMYKYLDPGRMLYEIYALLKKIKSIPTSSEYKEETVHSDENRVYLKRYLMKELRLFLQERSNVLYLLNSDACFCPPTIRQCMCNKLYCECYEAASCACASAAINKERHLHQTVDCKRTFEIHVLTFGIEHGLVQWKSSVTQNNNMQNTATPTVTTPNEDSVCWYRMFDDDG
jgi:hypothetical protein